MKRIGILMACGALTFGLTACDDDNGDGIMLMDAGTGGDDAGPDPMPDAGPTTPDSGPEQTCNVTATTSFPQLPAQCLPRCSDATIGCIQTCADAACQNACVNNDPTPTIPFFINGMPDGNIDCGTCINWQQTYCLYQVCPAETEAAIACQQGGGPCDAEVEAIETCTNENDEEFQGCFAPLLFACFGI